MTTNNTDLTTLARLAAEFRALQEAATKGPWEVRPKDYDDWGLVRAGDGMPVVDACCYARVPDEFQSMPCGPERTKGPPEVAANAAFIAHARNTPLATEALAAAEECERLRKRVAELEAQQHAKE